MSDLSISRDKIWCNRSGKNISWFHPRICPLPSGGLFMTLQSVGGSDFYGSLCESQSADGGKTWNMPMPVPDMGWKTLDNELTEGVCDIVPQYHKPTDTVLLTGYNVYYKQGSFYDSLGHWGKLSGGRFQRYSVWAVRDSQGNWIRTRQTFEVPKFRDCSCYSCGASQNVFVGDDRILIPFTIADWDRRDHRVCSACFRYDGENMKFLECGNEVELPVDRGLLEPSMTAFQNRYYLTLRAEDGRGYHAESEDGLRWRNLQSWHFDDGEELVMSTTQQHWLVLGNRLFLVYMRKLEDNEMVFRFRAPMLIAEVDENLSLKRNTEQVVFPLIPEGEHAAGMGNFHPVAISGNLGMITVGEERYFEQYRGDALKAVIRIRS